MIAPKTDQLSGADGDPNRAENANNAFGTEGAAPELDQDYDIFYDKPIEPERAQTNGDFDSDRNARERFSQQQSEQRGMPDPDQSASQENPAGPPEGWPTIAPDAYYGLAGEVVDAIAPHTESDPIAILSQLLAYFGNAIGRGPYYKVEGDRHHTNIFVALVGETSKARKGTSAGRVRQIFELADPEWLSERAKSGLSSGEGLIQEVRDPIDKQGKDGVERTDVGVADKRLMVTEPEFAGALIVMQRQGNILTRILRDAWDGISLGTLVKNNPLRATGTLISIVGHITADELRNCLDQVSMANGYANRFLFVCVRRSRLLPHGGNLTAETVSALALRMQQTIGKARTFERVTMTAKARKAWERVYAKLSEGEPGLLGAIVGRAEAQTIRLALLYALLDGKDVIDVVHLRAALAIWGYCNASARYIFGDLLGDPVADTILNALRNAGEQGLTKTQITDIFMRNRSAYQIDRALNVLRAAGKVKSVILERTGGRNTERWFIA